VRRGFDVYSIRARAGENSAINGVPMTKLTAVIELESALPAATPRSYSAVSIVSEEK
jgi:hypothetical protein